MNKSYSVGKIILRVLFVFVAVLFIINFSRKLYGGADLSFRAFLNWLGNVDYFGATKVVSAWTIGGNWGIVDGLRKFFNMFGNLFGVIFFMFSNFINLLRFLLQFVVFVLA